jgi:hypothetical protein
VPEPPSSWAGRVVNVVLCHRSACLRHRMGTV